MVTFSPGQTLMTVLVPTIADGARIGNYIGTGIILDRTTN